MKRGFIVEESKHRIDVKRVLVLIGSIILIMIGISLFFANDLRNIAVHEKAKTLRVAKLPKKTVQKHQKELKPADVSFDFSDAQPPTAAAVAQTYQNATPEKLPMVGGVAVPDLGISLPILFGVDNTSLMYGAGTMKPDEVQGQGNYALASHHVFGTGGGSLLFSPLMRAKVGQMIYTTDTKQTYVYRISDIFEVDPSDVSVIDDVPNKKLITLITCTDLQATKRLVVRGELVGEGSYQEYAGYFD